MNDKPKTYHLIAEVADMLDIPPSTLRWWEREIPELKPIRTKGGQRRYRPSDVEMVCRIKELVYNKGLSIEATSAFLKNSVPPKRRPPCKSDADARQILARLRSIVQDNPKALIMIESLEKYLSQ